MRGSNYTNNETNKITRKTKTTSNSKKLVTNFIEYKYKIIFRLKRIKCL